MRMKSERSLGKHDVWVSEISVRDTVSKRGTFSKLIKLIRKYEMLQEAVNP